MDLHSIVCVRDRAKSQKWYEVRIRAAAMSVATAFNWLANWAVTETFPRMSNWNLSATYVIYAVFALISLGFIARFVGETNGRELESV